MFAPTVIALDRGGADFDQASSGPRPYTPVPFIGRPFQTLISRIDTPLGSGQSQEFRTARLRRIPKNRRHISKGRSRSGLRMPRASRGAYGRRDLGSGRGAGLERGERTRGNRTAGELRGGPQKWRGLPEIHQKDGRGRSGGGSDEIDYVVIVGVVVDPTDPGWIRRTRVGQRRQPTDGQKEKQRKGDTKPADHGRECIEPLEPHVKCVSRHIPSTMMS